MHDIKHYTLLIKFQSIDYSHIFNHIQSYSYQIFNFQFNLFYELNCLRKYQSNKLADNCEDDLSRVSRRWVQSFFNFQRSTDYYYIFANICFCFVSFYLSYQRYYFRITLRWDSQRVPSIFNLSSFCNISRLAYKFFLYLNHSYIIFLSDYFFTFFSCYSIICQTEGVLSFLINDGILIDCFNYSISSQIPIDGIFHYKSQISFFKFCIFSIHALFCYLFLFNYFCFCQITDYFYFINMSKQINYINIETSQPTCQKLRRSLVTIKLNKFFVIVFLFLFFNHS